MASPGESMKQYPELRAHEPTELERVRISDRAGERPERDERGVPNARPAHRAAAVVLANIGYQPQHSKRRAVLDR